jgi:hypothetical protein
MPPDQEPKRPPRPIWVGPPPNVVGTVVALDPPVFLARNEEVAVAINELVAYPQGFELALTVRFRTVGDARSMHMMMGLDPGWRRAGGQVPPEMLRFGVEFSDGRKATNLDKRPPWDPTQPPPPPPSPVLSPQGGGGGGSTWNQRFWVWGLPPTGSLDFVCEWPARGCPLKRLQIDTSPLLAAASRAVVLWPEDPDGGARATGGNVSQIPGV